jgi:hypothetical protein
VGFCLLVGIPFTTRTLCGRAAQKISTIVCIELALTAVGCVAALRYAVGAPDFWRQIACLL